MNTLLPRWAHALLEGNEMRWTSLSELRLLVARGGRTAIFGPACVVAAACLRGGREGEKWPCGGRRKRGCRPLASGRKGKRCEHNKVKRWERGKCPGCAAATRSCSALSRIFCSLVRPLRDVNSKPSGLRAGRKLRNHRREERWSSKQYNKSHSVSHMKANPLGGSCMSKGIVVEKM